MEHWTGNDGVNLMLKEPTVGFNSVSPLKPERMVCPFPFYMLQIDAEGRVTVCTADWQMGACVGDASKDSLKAIWEGQPLRDLRVLMLREGRQAHPTCGACHNVISAIPAPNELDDDREHLLPLYLHQGAT
jgi:hypothetical protein